MIRVSMLKTFLLMILFLLQIKAKCPIEGTYCMDQELKLETCSSDEICSEDLKKWDPCLTDALNNVGSECLQYACLDLLEMQSPIWLEYIKCGQSACSCSGDFKTLQQQQSNGIVCKFGFWLNIVFTIFILFVNFKM